MSEPESFSSKVAGFAVGLGTLASAITGNYTGCRADDLECQVQNLHDAHEISKRDEDEDDDNDDDEDDGESDD
jgi:hypothetical protein